jgi:hypothetical protein
MLFRSAPVTIGLLTAGVTVLIDWPSGEGVGRGVVSGKG